MELSRLKNGRCIETEEYLLEMSMDLIHCNYKGFKSGKNLLVFKIKM
jgi:hypothetical protein